MTRVQSNFKMIRIQKDYSNMIRIQNQSKLNGPQNDWIPKWLDSKMIGNQNDSKIIDSKMNGNQNDSKMIGFQNDRNGKTTTTMMMMINKVNTMTPRQNDLVVKKKSCSDICDKQQPGS